MIKQISLFLILATGHISTLYGAGLGNPCISKWGPWQATELPSIEITNTVPEPVCAGINQPVNVPVKVNLQHGTKCRYDGNGCADAQCEPLILTKTTTWSVSSGLAATPDSGTGETATFSCTNPGTGTVTFHVEATSTEPSITLNDSKNVSITVLKVESVELVGAPSDGLVVKNGDDITMKANILPTTYTTPTGEPKWYYQRLKSDGWETTWTSFGTAASGKTYTHTTTLPGVFRVKTVLSVGGSALCEKVYERTSDEAHGYGKVGDPDAFGVADTQIQVDIRNAAKRFLGSTDYEVTDVVAAQYGFPEVAAGANKCNIFVAHRAAQAGATVPLIGGYFGGDPPSANQWAGQDDTHPILPLGVQTDIDHWILFLNPTYPQPGFIVGHPKLTGSGHVGIVDYNGQGIGAGSSGTVNKRYTPFLDGTSGFRRY